MTFAAALLGLIIGGALALFASGRSWQTVTAHRARPLADDVLEVTGRTLHPAVTGLAVVALAGVVGILASRGIARRIIGAVLVIAGADRVLGRRDGAARDLIGARAKRCCVMPKPASGSTPAEL